MKNYCAFVKDGTISEIIVSDYAWATANLQGDWHDLGAEPLTVAIGDTYDADLGEFVTPEITEIVTEEESVTPDETE